MITVITPTYIKNVYYQVAVYDSAAEQWVITTESRMTTITLDAPEDEMQIRARACKKYDVETVEGKWSNKVVVDAEGTVTGEDKSGRNILIVFIVGIVLILGGTGVLYYLLCRKKMR